MGLLSQIVNDAQDVQATEEYVATGSKKYTVSGNHVMKINMAKIKESDGGALAVSLELEDEEGIKVYEDAWITTKEKKTYYVNKEGEKRELPSYAQMCGLNFLLSGVWGLPATEPKEIKEYDWTVSKEVFKTRDVITPWIGQVIGVSVQVTQEDSYKDKTQPITKVSAAHFFDPVSLAFASEKKSATEPAMHAKFAEKSENVPVLDKRNLSKGTEAATTKAVDKEQLGF